MLQIWCKYAYKANLDSQLCDVYNMQQNINEYLILLTVIRLQEVRNMQKAIRILSSTVKVSLITADIVSESSYTLFRVRKGTSLPLML